MRSLSRRSVNRPRPILMLETLEDRRVMSVGGLFAALQPFAVAEASHSPLSSTLTSLVAVPTTALHSVGTRVEDLEGTASAGPVKTPAVDVPVNLNVDLPFLHVENLRLDVGVNPVGLDRPVLTLAGGGNTAFGSPTGSLLNIAPATQIDLGGSNLMSVAAGTQAETPSGPGLDVHAGAGTGAPSGVAASVNAGGAQGILNLPSAGTAGVLPGSPTGDGLRLITPAGNNSAGTVPNVIFGAPSAAAPLAAPRATAVDGAGGSSVDAAANAATPLTGVPVVDGAAGDVTAPPLDLGGGTDAETVLVNPDLEASGLTTRFQPYQLDGGRDLGTFLGQTGAPSGWLAAWLTRLSRLAPWLSGLIAAGVMLEIRRRRRRAARALNRPLA